MAEVKRIAIYGTESTGKSSLAAGLAAHFGEPWAEEYVREFWDTHDGRISGPDLELVARGQMANEEAAAARARRIVFCDTELLTNVQWADLLYPGCCPPWLRGAAEERCRRYTLYLLCAPDLPWAYDPQRAFPDEATRARQAKVWQAKLERRGLPFVVIRGVGEARLQAAIAAVQAVLA